jgi:hypothetical protein
MKLCSFISRALTDDRTRIQLQSEGRMISAAEKLWFGILAVSNLFLEFSSRPGNFGGLANIGGIKAASGEFFLDSLWNMIKQDMFSYLAALRSYHPGVTLENTQVYMQQTTSPNVLSFYHLSYQILLQDHVYSPPQVN